MSPNKLLTTLAVGLSVVAFSGCEHNAPEPQVFICEDENEIFMLERGVSKATFYHDSVSWRIESTDGLVSRYTQPSGVRCGAYPSAHADFVPATEYED